MSNQLLFQVTNHHGKSHGIPPQIDEQIFLYDYEQECGTLYMGDAGWEYPYDVVDGKVAELTLSHPEHVWLLACWEASGALKATRKRIRQERRRGQQPNEM